jgi:acetyltransferase
MQERLSFCSGEKQALQIEEMDLNPVLLYEKGLDVVDARIILKE